MTNKETHRLLAHYTEAILNLTDNCIRFQWSHEFYGHEVEALKMERGFRSMPKWARERWEGYRLGLYVSLQRATEPAWLIGSTWHTVETIGNRSTKGLYAARVFRSDNCKVWLESGRSTI